MIVRKTSRSRRYGWAQQVAGAPYSGWLVSRRRCAMIGGASALLLAVAFAATVPVTAPLRLQFREPYARTYEFEPLSTATFSATGQPIWLRAHRVGATHILEFGRRVVLRLTDPNQLSALLAGTPLQLGRTVTSNLFILDAPDALTAAHEAAQLATLPQVQVSYPVRRGRAALQWSYAARPNDPYFGGQWHLENRDTNTAVALGDDLNIREAWPVADGAGIVVAQADNGLDTNHPDLMANLDLADSYNFDTGVAEDGAHEASYQAHGTAVAGLIAAVGNNHVGVVGTAPGAHLASWVVFDSNNSLVDEVKLMDMFEYRSNVVAVENHSWGNAAVQQLPLSVLENQGIANAIRYGRDGKGVVMVRAAGNEHLTLNDVNDDGYAQDPRVIAVGAVRSTGRATSFSTPGAEVLVSAFSGDFNVDLPDGSVTNYPSIFTTDRVGALGYNTNTSDDMGDYAFGDTGFSGTSAACPQIAGLCALILAANPQLTYRDVQQVLIFSSRQLDRADPSIQTNGAGFLVSHNTGFGVPDAGLAVHLARVWKNRPPTVDVTVSNNMTAAPVPIPDDGLRVLVTGTNVPPGLASIPAFPSDGLEPDDPTAVLPLVDVGQALTPITQDLTNKAALIKRGTNYFAQKIGYAVAAGARFVVMYNNRDGTNRVFMDGADIQFSPIPSVFIDQTNGEALAAYVDQHPEARAQLHLNTVTFALTVTNTLICEHVRLHAVLNHPRGSDVRITLLSPAGTRSILHHFNEDTTALGAWDYYSVQDFYESSAGTWTVAVSDEQPGATGTVEELDLTITGVPIKDTDHDGLDDDWEMAHFGTLAYGPQDDPDGDGWNNMREQILDWDPMKPDPPFVLNLSPWNAKLARVSWPGTTNTQYHVLRATAANQPFQVVTNVAGTFPTTSVFLPMTNQAGFFRVETVR